MFPMINEILSRGTGVRITVTGRSMYPFLREIIDGVELLPGDFNSICKGDIVIILRDNGEYVMHRVLKKDGNFFYMVGDAQLWVEGPVRADQIRAVVSAIWKGNKKIASTNPVWRLSSIIWLYLPLRKLLFKVYKVVKIYTGGY